MSSYSKRFKIFFPVPVLLFCFALIYITVSPTLVLAQGGGRAPAPGTGPITNPLGSIDSIPKLIDAILKIVVKVGLPLVALAIIYVGFLFVKAQGEPGKLTEAKEAFLYTVIGAGIVLGAFVISQAIQATVTSLGA